MPSTSARHNPEKGILFPTKLQNINALKRSRKHSRKLVNVLLLSSQYLHASHPDYFFTSLPPANVMQSA